MSFSSTYKGAGVTMRMDGESAANCVKPNTNTPGTPEHIKKYRKSYKMQPGVTIQHYGRVNDPLPHEKHAYGIKTLDSDHVDGVIKQKKENFQDVVTDMKEGKYASAKREPLGKGMSRDYVYPNAINKNDQFRYGNSTIMSDYTAKEVIFPPTDGEDTAESKNQYVRSHGAYEAGEQKRRGYNWHVEPENHRFGLKPKEDLKNAARMCLQPETKDNVFPGTTIVKKNVEDHRNFQNDPLGRGKNLGQTNPKIDPNQPAGKVGGGDEWSAGQCIRGHATIAEMTRNDFIGTATKFGYRNQPKDGDDKRVFGVPTLRTDVNKPNSKSIADPNNYGDEPMAVELLFPQKFAELGISKEDFQKLRPKSEIRQIFESIGVRYKPGKFEGIFLRARQMCGSDFEEASAEAFLNAVVEMHHLE